MFSIMALDIDNLVTLMPVNPMFPLLTSYCDIVVLRRIQDCCVSEIDEAATSNHEYTQHKYTSYYSVANHVTQFTW